MFIISKSDFFQLIFLYTIDTRAFLLQKDISELSELNTFKPRKHHFIPYY